MFLWLTSNEGDDLVLDGPSIFTGTTLDSAGKRDLIPNTNGANFSMALRTGKVDDIGDVGQAGSHGVLLSQQEALVYYGIHANDVYGYFLSGQMTGGIKDAVDFPRNISDLKTVMAYAHATYGVQMLNPEALAIEIKTSWVDVKSVPNPDTYVTIEAEVPIYEKSADNLNWSPPTSGATTETIRLALLGIHIVGTVEDHPEFVWSTFEHIANAPDTDYFYTNSSEQIVGHPFSSSGDFVFMTTGPGRLMPTPNVCVPAARILWRPKIARWHWWRFAPVVSCHLTLFGLIPGAARGRINQSTC